MVARFLSAVALIFGVVVLFIALGLSYTKLQETRNTLHDICTYQQAGTRQGNERAEFQKELALIVEDSLREAAIVQPKLAAKYMRSVHRLEFLAEQIRPRRVIDCP